jgi:hypothetical protein
VIEVRQAGWHPQGTLFAACRTSEAKVAGAEQPDQSNQDQINGDDEIEQFWHRQNENPGGQGNQWCKTQLNIHDR